MHFDPKLKNELKDFVLQKMHKQAQRVQILSPYPLSQEELSLVKKELPFLQEAELENVVDKTLLAGIVLKFGSKMIDLSVKGELRHIKNMVQNI